MNKDAIFTAVQKALKDVPVILIGTGATIPLEIPGMEPLSQHLQTVLTAKYGSDSTWNAIAEQLESGIDLETALTDIALSNDLLNDIVEATWNLIAEADIAVFNKYVLGKQPLALSELISYFYQWHPQCVNVITTNYDRVLEYACDQKRIHYDTRFQGGYIRYFSTSPAKAGSVVNIYKVHGSLDLFRDGNDLVYSIPGPYISLPNGFLPEIISPGISKYRAVLTGGCQTIFIESNAIISKAKSFLCYGYGFNDEHIQTGIMAQIQTGKPIVVVTKCISDKAAGLLVNNSSNFITIEENPDAINSTRFTINKDYHYLDGNFWSIDGFMQIFL